jgi:ferric-dicitrate binding protein FerR (iron transport regulator)
MPQDKEFSNEVVQEAAFWLGCLERDGEADGAAFIRWVSSNPQHVRQLLELHAVLFEARQVLRNQRSLVEAVRRWRGN